MSMNQVLNSVDDLKQKNMILTDKISKLKAYKKIFVNSISMQCVNCSVFIPRSKVLSHYESCSRNIVERGSNNFVPTNSQMKQLSNWHNAKSMVLIDLTLEKNTRIDMSIERNQLKIDERSSHFIEYPFRF